MITTRRILALVAACGAVLRFCLAGSYCAGCTTAERAPIERKLSAALTDENLACLIGTHVTGQADVHAAVVLACAVAPDATGGALELLRAADALHLGDPSAAAATNLAVARTLVDAIPTVPIPRDAGADR